MFNVHIKFISYMFKTRQYQFSSITQGLSINLSLLGCKVSYMHLKTCFLHQNYYHHIIFAVF